MLSWAVWFKFLLNKVIANTCLFTLTSFSKQSASWKVLEICELCALSTDSRKTYSVNKYMYTGSSSYSFDWGGEIIRWGGGGKKRKRPSKFNYPGRKTGKFCKILFVTENFLNELGWFIQKFPCLNFVCCCDVFQVSSKNFINLGGVL